MADAPRTDAIFPIVGGCPVVVPETIYELREKFEAIERELAESRAKVARLQEKLCNVFAWAVEQVDVSEPHQTVTCSNCEGRKWVNVPLASGKGIANIACPKCSTRQTGDLDCPMAMFCRDPKCAVHGKGHSE